jgi:hypothetical protein
MRYTYSLKEIAEIDVNQQQGTGGQGTDGDGEYYEMIRLGLREVRAWLRGRYAGSVDVEYGWGVLFSDFGFRSVRLAKSERDGGYYTFSFLLPHRRPLPLPPSLILSPR